MTNCKELLGEWSTFLAPDTLAALETAWQRMDEERTLLPELVYPPRSETLAAFALTPPSQVRVVILGQDPYHGEGQAMGLAFSVHKKARPPPSLVNILKEANAWPAPHGSLVSWAEQGVLLLNSCLTVRQGRPRSHATTLGWEMFTDGVIRDLCSKNNDLIFLLWGKDAQAKSHLIDKDKHNILSTGHPSPLAAVHGFAGCGHFAKTNELLVAARSPPIRWALEDHAA